MGVSVEVGYLADIIANDPEGAELAFVEYEWMEEELAAKKLEGWQESTSGEIWSVDFHGYAGLNALREVAGIIWKQKDIPRNVLLDGSQSQNADALVKSFFEHISGKGEFTLVGKAFRQIFKVKEKPKLPPFVHLLVHSDCDGFYVPVAFELPIVPKSVAPECEHLWPLGSVMRLEAEVNQLARYLEIPSDLHHDDDQLLALLEAPDRTPIAALWTAQPVAAHACLVLREACAQSLRTGAAIHFC